MNCEESCAEVEGHYQQKLAFEPLIDDIGCIFKCFVAKRVSKMLGMLMCIADVESTGLTSSPWLTEFLRPK